ncbi:MAG TPA: hypothetical protein DHW42_08300 [Candidatus Marinimicrobia bacterium]|nr:hypothetical protein [Candidatus Neomarinimicrobiota bacterium]
MNAIIQSSFTVLGAGKTGVALAYHLEKAGFEPSFLWNRSQEGLRKALKRVHFRKCSTDLSQIPAHCEWIIITVKDDAIEEVVQRLVNTLKDGDGKKVFHTSGAWDSKPLEPLQKQGCRTGSFHPLISIPDIETGIRMMPGSVFSCEGEIRDDLLDLARLIGVTGIVLNSEQKETVHLGAVFINNYITVLIQALKRLARTKGIPDDTLKLMLERLAGQALGSAWNKSLKDSLSGPAVRGDEKTIQKHRRQLENMPELKKLYDQFLALTRQLLSEEK